MAGQPTKYNKSVLAAANKYIDEYKTEYQHAIPSIAGLAVVLKVCRKTLYNWADNEKNKEFLYTLSRLATSQEFELLNSGLKGEFSPTITKLVLSNNHSYSEKAEAPQEEAPPIDIHFHVKEAVAEIKTTNAKS